METNIFEFIETMKSIGFILTFKHPFYLLQNEKMIIYLNVPICCGQNWIIWFKDKSKNCETNKFEVKQGEDIFTYYNNFIQSLI
jgi:hypothetical protein